MSGTPLPARPDASAGRPTDAWFPSVRLVVGRLLLGGKGRFDQAAAAVPFVGRFHLLEHRLDLLRRVAQVGAQVLYDSPIAVHFSVLDFLVDQPTERHQTSGGSGPPRAGRKE